MKLERILTKLKFDESVNGYALITSNGHPFLSFSLPDDVLPRIKGTLRIHGADLKLVNVMTDKGIVILARVDPDWVLAVLFDPDFQLGGALSRTKAVTDLLVQVDLPPPPSSIDVEEDLLYSESEPVTISTEPEGQIDFSAPVELLEPDIVLEEIIPEPEIPVSPEPEELAEPDSNKLCPI